MVSLSDIDILKFINIPIFITSLAIGLFIVYITIPAPKIIYVYPTPDNINKLQFKDYSDNCFTFEAEKVECSEKSGEIKEIPVQHA